MTLWFTSDTHFDHANIIEFCARPFASVDEMNRAMIERWNARVQPGDRVYHLGDFAFGPYSNVAKFLAPLNGQVLLIRGNHDRSQPRMLAAGFSHVCEDMALLAYGLAVHLTHKPAVDLPQGINLNLHGHVHHTYARRGHRINVGVDVRGFAPTTLAELLETPDV